MTGSPPSFSPGTSGSYGDWRGSAFGRDPHRIPRRDIVRPGWYNPIRGVELVLSPQELRELVAVMREVGAVQADGVILGPPPTKLEQLERKAAETPDLVDRDELEAERRRQAIAAARQEVRDKIGADLSDEQCDRFIRPDSH